MRIVWIGLLMVGWSSCVSIPLSAEPGDVRFRAGTVAVIVSNEPVRAMLDVFLDVESVGTIVANGWSLAAEIIAQPGSEGTVFFDPPPILGNLPNLPPASHAAFADFDRQQGGGSYGTTGQSSLELIAFAPYIPPAINPPLEDALGNITVPTGAGLVSVPLRIEPGTQGDFLIQLQQIPSVTGVSFAASNAPGDVAFHANGAYQSGLVRVAKSVFLTCDLDRNLTCDAGDIDLLTESIRTGATGSSRFDLNGDSLVDAADRVFWVENLMHTYFGDSNLDLEFNTSDLVQILIAGEYEDSFPANSRWATGDWNGDGEFNTADMVLVLQKGGYELGPRATVRSVPEPIQPLRWIGICVLVLLRRRSRS